MPELGAQGDQSRAIDGPLGLRRMARTVARAMKLHPGWVVVAAAFMLMFGNWNANAGFGVFMPVLSREFGWSRGAISIAAALNLVIGGAIAFAVGSATDRYGPRRVLAMGTFLVSLSYLLASTVNSLWHFYLSMGFLIGVGASGMYLVPTATVSRWFVEHRGLALGIILAALNLGYVTGPPLSAFLIGLLGWRLTYVVLGGLVLCFALPGALFIKSPPAGGGPHAIAAAGARGASSGSAPPPFVAAGATFREAAKDSRLWFLAGSWLLLGFAHMMVSIHAVSYVRDLGVTLEKASLALTTYGVSSIVGRIGFGAATDRLGTRPTFWFCLVLQLVALLWLLTGPPLWSLYMLIVAFGLATAGSDTTVVRSASEIFGIRSIGAIMGVLSLGWRIGAASGPVVAGYIYDATGFYTLAFGLASAGLLVSSVFFALGFKPAPRRARAANVVH
ncbi:MAG TPA: MFS transporter [Dehalococcoidia bacterium]|nr:MFS transporter [Dehalococcoidia bacterium]